MTTPLFDPPEAHILPLSKGGDLVVDFQYSEEGEFVDYPAGVEVFLEIDTDPVTVAEGVVTDHHGVCRIESTVCDTITGTMPRWRCVLRYPGSPTTEVVVSNGKTKRYDG